MIGKQAAFSSKQWAVITFAELVQGIAIGANLSDGFQAKL
jgi:hypothetical protein